MAIRVLEVPVGTRKMYEAFMMKVWGSGLVPVEQTGGMNRWSEKLYEVLGRLGEEYQRTFLKELARQVLRRDGKPYDVEDAILKNTLGKMVMEADELMQRHRHPSLELMCKRLKNCIHPYGSVLFRAPRFVARRNTGSITVQMTGSTLNGELEEMVDILDSLMEEEVCDAC